MSSESIIVWSAHANLLRYFFVVALSMLVLSVPLIFGGGHLGAVFDGPVAPHLPREMGGLSTGFDDAPGCDHAGQSLLQASSPRGITGEIHLVEDVHTEQSQTTVQEQSSHRTLSESKETANQQPEKLDQQAKQELGALVPLGRTVNAPLYGRTLLEFVQAGRRGLLAKAQALHCPVDWAVDVALVFLIILWAVGTLQTMRLRARARSGSCELVRAAAALFDAINEAIEELIASGKSKEQAIEWANEVFDVIRAAAEATEETHVFVEKLVGQVDAAFYKDGNKDDPRIAAAVAFFDAMNAAIVEQTERGNEDYAFNWARGICPAFQEVANEVDETDNFIPRFAEKVKICPLSVR